MKKMVEASLKVYSVQNGVNGIQMMFTSGFPSWLLVLVVFIYAQQ